MIPQFSEFSALKGHPCEIGESPVCVNESSLVWVDAGNARIYQSDLTKGEVRGYRMDVPVTAIASAGPDAWILVTKEGIFRCDERFRQLKLLGNPVRGLLDLVLNDGVVSPCGDLWFGSMNERELEASDGSLYLMLHDSLKIVQLDIGFSVTNGIAFNRKLRRAYVSNMFQRQVIEYTLAPDFRHILKRRVLITIPEHKGMPDGLKVDSFGYLYVCHWDAGLVSIYNSVGSLLKEVQLPVRHATRCTFGGPGFRQLFVTTGNYGMDKDEQFQSPWSGLTLCADISVSGEAEETFNLTPEPSCV
ncbi:hypothetical protein BTA51_26485 [Hahella sp. CCB-MM4]|uniref:SMP-30/gluconolactonase/LRE family protein n=1 Tax=Hahella sp. (strain CCB-MM4) TaxID=1926491 RepID=UPI000B9BEB8B|nr:SMP-30/gluconolactonase/LRE family protein [Hahella sp. CCB-MM4]OZG70390.1 hypothetical protein BTA51_26485 [Hahella sp. CCB-MM4]